MSVLPSARPLRPVFPRSWSRGSVWWFMRTETDVLAVGSCNLRKNDQNPALRKINAQVFELNWRFEHARE